MRNWVGVYALLGVALLHYHAEAQQQHTPTRPGVTRQGKFLGYVPMHERLTPKRKVQPPKPVTFTDDTADAAPSDSAVQPASHTVDADWQAPQAPVHHAGCGCDACGSPVWKPGFYGGAEYLYWNTKGADARALVTTSPNGTSQDAAGVLGAAATQTLFGGDALHETERSGGRYRLGMWLDSAQTVGLEFSFVNLEDDETSFSRTSTGDPILARPFFNVQLNEQDSRLIAFPNLIEGTVSVRGETSFDTFEILMRRSLMQTANGRGDLLFGYRHASLDDLLRIDENTTATGGAANGSTFALFDQFVTENEFHGGQIGLQYTGTLGAFWELSLLAKIGLGNSTARIRTSGQTVTTSGTDTNTVAGGLLTQASNLGTTTVDEFTTFNEFGVTLKRRFQCGLSATIGYSLLTWNDVARAAEFDTSVNPTQIPPSTLTGEARPNAGSTDGEFWARGLTAGLEYRF